MYVPSDEILAKYADLLVKYALGGGTGPEKGQVVELAVPDSAKPLFSHLLRATLECGAHPKINYLPTLTSKIFFTHALDHHLEFFPEAYKRAEAALIDHQVSILSDRSRTR
jgi:leucyl aminopeptidase (aminopeptidase T)